jgi:hypothetical protein
MGPAWQLLGGVVRRSLGDGAPSRARWLESAYQHADPCRTSRRTRRPTTTSSARRWPLSRRRLAPLGRRLALHGARSEREYSLQNAGRREPEQYLYQQFADLLFPTCRRANGQTSRGLRGSPREDARVLALTWMRHLPMFGDDDGTSRLDPARACRFRRARHRRHPSAGEFREGGDPTTRLAGWSVRMRTPVVRCAVGGRRPRSHRFPRRVLHPRHDFETPDEIRVVADVGPLGYREIAGTVTPRASFTPPGRRSSSIRHVRLITRGEWRGYPRHLGAQHRASMAFTSARGGQLRGAQGEGRRTPDNADEAASRAVAHGLPDPVTHCRRLC